MNALYQFLEYLKGKHDSPFLVDGTMHLNDNVFRELIIIDALCNFKFSLNINETDAIIHLINNWAPRADAKVKHVYWKNHDSIVTIYYQLNTVEVSSDSHQFINECTNYVNQMGWRFRRG